MDTNTYMPVAPVGNGFDGGAAMTGQDIEHIDLMTHTLKSIATLEAMRNRRPRYEEYRRY